MNTKLYNLMDWPGIEGIVYAEQDHPEEVLGAVLVKNQVLIRCFFPDAAQVDVVLDGKSTRYSMEMADEAGYFAVLIPGKRIPRYYYEVTYTTGTVKALEMYPSKSIFTQRDLTRFANGIHYEIYDKLGAHPMEMNGEQGVAFAVWAPNALSVSVVGDFNLWDGRRHLMTRQGESGIFELFIPMMCVGELYKYEIHKKGGEVVLKSDPYGNYAELRPHTASVVWNLEEYTWQDETWLTSGRKNLKKEAMTIYEVHLGSFRKPKDQEFYNYRELAPMLTEYCLKMGYTHVELMPVMEHPFDGSWGYQVTGYYAPTSRYGTPDDFMYMVDALHQSGIGVILDWVPAHFPKDEHGLAQFDGTCLYEHFDKRQGEHPHWGTLIYNYGRPQVSNFLIANALFWLEKYHVDGIRLDAVASMLYLDYGKNDGEWVANIYGGNENLEAIEMLKQLNQAVHKRKDNTITIAEESTAWPKVTGSIEDGGLGFDYKWNMGWMNDYLEYIQTDPLFRKGRHGMLTFSMIYHYSEDFVLVLSHDEVVHLKGSMYEKMPGEKDDKLASLRLSYGYMAAHPGKKLLFMGQDFGQEREWSEERELDWNLVEEDEGHKKLLDYVAELNHFYQEHPAMFKNDYQPSGFRWISELDADHSVITFLRKCNEETLMVVCNFTPVSYDKFRIGVPIAGKYKEIFNSDMEEYGGTGVTNPRAKTAKPVKFDGRNQSIEIKLPPLGMCVFQVTKPKKK